MPGSRLACSTVVSVTYSLLIIAHQLRKTIELPRAARFHGATVTTRNFVSMLKQLHHDNKNKPADDMSTLRARSGTTTELRKATSRVHQGHCQPCILCKKENQSKYYHPKSWKDNSLLLSLRDYEPSLNIQPESCICKSCRNDISHISEDGFIPRWRKVVSNKSESECCVPACTNNVYRITKLVDTTSVCKFFSEQDENVPESSMHEEGVGLCKDHYGTWYRYTVYTSIHSNPNVRHVKRT